MKENNKTKVFPKGFFWGASMASHQVEGGNYNQWTVWELEHANEQAKNAQKRIGWVPVWDEIKEAATDPNNYVSGMGVDHFNRYKEDFDLAKSLNLNALRFSIEWSRIEPEEGKWDTAAIEHYRTYIKELKARGLEPFLNIWHWTNPVWFEKKAGFLRRGNSKYFYRFAQKVIEEFGSELKYVIILNEPNNYAFYSFAMERWPSPRVSLLSFGRVYLNLMSIHRKTYKLIKKMKPELQISSAPQYAINVPLNSKKIMHRFGAWSADFANNWIWASATKRYVDFIGFNNYFKNYMKGVGTSNFANPTTPLNDFGWYMEPRTVGEMALAISKRYPGKPIIVTENGLADRNDTQREWWIDESIKALVTAVQQGADIRGYFHWSLLDNFEWEEGWWPKFGLIAVDREHGMKRIVRPSAQCYATRIKATQQP